MIAACAVTGRELARALARRFLNNDGLSQHHRIALESFLIGDWQMMRPVCHRRFLRTLDCEISFNYSYPGRRFSGGHLRLMDLEHEQPLCGAGRRVEALAPCRDPARGSAACLLGDTRWIGFLSTDGESVAAARGSSVPVPRSIRSRSPELRVPRGACAWAGRVSGFCDPCDAEFGGECKLSLLWRGS